MATLQELCKDIPVSIQNTQRMNVWCENMRKRMNNIPDKDIFGTCQTGRPKRKFRNRVSTEQAGKIGSYVCVQRFTGSYITVACKRRANEAK